MKVRVWIWKHLTLKSLIDLLFTADSVTGFRSLVWISSNLCVFLIHQHRIAFSTRKELQPLYSLVNSTPQNISENLDAETTTVKSIVSSKLPDVFSNWNTRMNLDQVLIWLWNYKAAFPTIHLLLSVGLTV